MTVQMLFLISLIFLHGQMCRTGGYPYFLNRAADYLIRMADGALPREPFMQIGKFLGLKLAWQADNLFFKAAFSWATFTVYARFFYPGPAVGRGIGLPQQGRDFAPVA